MGFLYLKLVAHFSPVFEQESCPPIDRGGSSENIGLPRSIATNRWLNVILDLNGILCVCEEFRLLSKSIQLNILSKSRTTCRPALVGPKAVYVRPNCSDFLRKLGEIAFIGVWSSMKKNNTEGVCRHLFRGIELPLLMLGQDSCTTLKCKDRQGRISTFRVPGTQKELFLKNLDTIFNDFGASRFTPANTIIVDDSPSKHILNKPENVVLTQTWSYVGDGDRDTFLISELLPWIQRMHESRDQGLLFFRRNNTFGGRMLCNESDPRLYKELMGAVCQSRHIR